MFKNNFIIRNNFRYYSYNILPRNWKLCNVCNVVLFVRKIKFNLNVCYNCGYHFRISARERIKFILDYNSHIELFDYIYPIDFLNFFDIEKYYIRLAKSQRDIGEIEALLVFKGKIKSIDVIVCVFEFDFIGGSMGNVVGSKFISAVNMCLKNKLPLICFSSSGGARMQESLLSLFQMSRVSNILSKMKFPYLSVIVNPCMGGVTASLAMLGDINISEPRVLVGFTGPKVIKNTIRGRISNDFQCSESLLRRGFLDFIVTRKELKSKIYNVLDILRVTHI